MAESLTTFPHDFDFSEDDRRNVVLTGSIRLVPSRHVVELTPDVDTRLFPVTGTHYVVSSLFQPAAVRQWVGFQANITHHSDGTNPTTGDGFRLHDGTNQWYWNGAAWAISVVAWNTELEIAANIATFAATTRKLRVVVRLTTTDPLITPVLNWVRIAWTGKVFFLEDLIYRTLVPKFKACRAVFDFAIKVAFPGGTALDVLTAVSSMLLPLDVVDVEAVFNQTTDSGHYTNLLSSYNTGTGIATLSSAVPVGSHAFCRLVVRPQVAVQLTSQDYTEVEKAPALIIQGIESVDSSELAVQTGVVNKSAGTILRIPPPYRFDLRFTMVALAPGAVDLTRIIDAIVELMVNSPTITSAALGEEYRFYMIDEFNDQTRPNTANLHQMQATFKICEVLAFKRASVSEVPVLAVNLTFDPL